VIFPRLARLSAATALPLVVAACRDATSAFGSNPATARQNADDFVGAYASRLTNVTRTPKVSYIRLNLGRSTLIPSRVFGDTAIWTARLGDSTRIAAYNGAFTGERYYFFARTPPDRLDKPADSFHSTRLRRLSRDEYEWTTIADFVLGRSDAAVLPTLLARALRAAESQGADGVRADYRSNFRRTTAALGRLYSIDSLRITRDNEGASHYALTISANPDKLRRSHPGLADYIKKYIDRTRMRIVITDRRGARWFDLSVRDKRVHMRLRSRNGELAPLDGSVRSLPDSLIVRTDFATHILLFDVGFRNLVADLSVVRGEGERFWELRSTREPEWDLPPLTRRFIRTPLRRPFMGAGVNFRIGVRETENGPTLFSRRALLRVQESALIRFLGRLSGTAMSDFYGKSEMDENSFNGDAFRALRADLNDVLASPRSE
jgi:hypothetical protein